jgi:hypothetical protein
MKLGFCVAACWLEKIWHMDFESIPVANKEEVLRSLGVDPVCFREREYKMAKIESLAGEMKKHYNDMQKSIDSLFARLRVSTETEYRVPAT